MNNEIIGELRGYVYVPSHEWSEFVYMDFFGEKTKTSLKLKDTLALATVVHKIVCICNMCEIIVITRIISYSYSIDIKLIRIRFIFLLKHVMKMKISRIVAVPHTYYFRLWYHDVYSDSRMIIQVYLVSILLIIFPNKWIFLNAKKLITLTSRYNMYDIGLWNYPSITPFKVTRI